MCAKAIASLRSTLRRPQCPWLPRSITAIALLTLWLNLASSATTQKRYYAHDAVEDRYGVIAPWYQGQNGQTDLRVRVAAEFLKRYPWVDTDKSVMAGPHWLFNGGVDLAADGSIKVLPAENHMNGNVGQRFKYFTEALPRYYRYSGDPVVFGYMKIAADFVLDNYLTPADHPWPKFPISVPVGGKPYGHAAPGAWIQLDLSAGIGLGLIRAYRLTGDARYFDAAKHVGDVFAAKCDHRPGAQPWHRYAEHGEAPWCDHPSGNRLTGGVASILIFLDELMHLGYTGQDGTIRKSRDAGRDYLRDTLLPAWTVNDTWGRHYWDWEHPVQGILPTGWVVQYLMDHKDEFPNWKYDVRNILGLDLNHTGVSPASNGDVYSGAWAYPESCGCCGRSLDACPVFLSHSWARYAVETGSPWAKEIARRATILGFYSFHESGMCEDNIDGGQITAKNWSEIIGLGPILYGLDNLGWMPEVLGAARENHLVRSSSTVTSVVYGKGRIEYTTFDAPANSVDVLRLAFRPSAVTAENEQLPPRQNLNGNGWTAKSLPNGDAIVSIRHDGSKSLVITGDDPQQVMEDGRLNYEGRWTVASDAKDSDGAVHRSDVNGAKVTCRFQGNQVRWIGRTDPWGGRSDVYLDGVKQPVVIDCWSPQAERHRQVLYCRNGLANGPHELQIVAQGQKNPYAKGSNVYVDAIQSSSAASSCEFGSGGGPTGAQRMIFGYGGRTPYIDSHGHEWLPATEWIVRSGPNTDSVLKSWWTKPVKGSIVGTADAELYRYGAHAPEFWANVTVGSGIYDVRLKFSERRDDSDPARCPINVAINGRQVVSSLDVARKAGGRNRVLDLSFETIAPKNGIIEVRFTAVNGGEAIVQALEVVPH
jgi:hypothetical protein